MNSWKFLWQTFYICFIGFSVFAFSFVVSLLIGTAADHPILGPVQQLFETARTIVACSIGISVANALSYVPINKIQKRQSYAVRSRLNLTTR